MIRYLSSNFILLTDLFNIGGVLNLINVAGDLALDGGNDTEGDEGPVQRLSRCRLSFGSSCEQ